MPEKKAELKAIADRYEMGIIREKITGPELDPLANKMPLEKFEGIFVTKEYSPCDNTHTYRVYFPANWFDLWGWKD